MANRFPLIVDSAALQIKELPSGDNVDMTGSGIVSATSIGSTDINITGVSTVITGIVTNLTADSLTVTGVSTAITGIVTNLTADSLTVTGVSTLGIVEVSAGGIVTATSGIVTYYGDGQYLQNITAGISGIEILDEGSSVGTGITILDFAGGDVAAVVSGAAATITVTSSGGGGGGSGLSTTGISTAMIWSNPSIIQNSVDLTEANYNYGAFGPITVAVGATVTVGAANTFVVV